MPQRAERLGILLGEAGERRAGLVEILVDDNAGAVAEDRGLLHGRFDIGKPEAIEFEILEQGTKPHPHIEIRMQIEL